MVNREIGEIAIESNGQRYTLVLTTAAMELLEDHYSTPEHEATWEEVWGRLINGSVKGVSRLIWAMLQEHHEGMTIRDAQKVIDGVGGLPGMRAVLEGASTSMTPDPADAQELGLKNENPRKARAAKRRRAHGDDVFTSMRAKSA